MEDCPGLLKTSGLPQPSPPSRTQALSIKEPGTPHCGFLCLAEGSRSWENLGMWDLCKEALFVNTEQLFLLGGVLVDCHESQVELKLRGE